MTEFLKQRDVALRGDEKKGLDRPAKENQGVAASKGRWEKRRKMLASFQPSGDIAKDAKDYWDIIGLNYAGSHIGKLLEEKDGEGIAEQLRYTASAGERSGFEDIDRVLDLERQVIQNILEAHESQKKEAPDINLILPQEWAEYKKLRLEALKDDPQAFGALYEEEAARTDEEWKERVARFHKTDSKFSVIKMFAVKRNKEFIGMGGFFRSAPHVARISEMYVEKDSRGGGIGGSLLKTILEEIGQDGRFNQVELIVDRKQQKAIRLYERFGFVVAKTVESDTDDLSDKYLMTKQLEEITK